MFPIFTTSRYGKPVIVLGRYRYNQWSRCKGPRARYVCVKACYGCRATVITMNGEIVRFKGNEAPIYSTSRYGKPVILMGTYRFNLDCRSKAPRLRFVCVKASNGCKASLFTIVDKIVKMNDNHNHK